MLIQFLVEDRTSQGLSKQDLLGCTSTCFLKNYYFRMSII